MKVYLLPNRFKRYGWIIFIPSLILMIVMHFVDIDPDFLEISVFAIANQGFMQQTEYFTFLEKNITVDLALIMLITGGVLVCFSKEKLEDEYIRALRLESLVWAVVINYALLLLAIIFLHGLSFFYALTANMITILLIFILRFEWIKQKIKKEDLHEE